MRDDFSDHTVSLESPIVDALPVAPDDAVDLPRRPRALWIGEQGDVAVRIGGTATAIVFRNAGGLLPIRPDRVLAGATTASGILALY
ncbi:MAG: hypothetical protein JKP98_02580 [Rhodobacteraceae bacterium]|jgi:hypothetical protein|nr:hypothetical protein [Paracoccaceae bacterium]MBL4556482.1 hypothetical protein [Paracoccaceae bacterium]HBG99140.1 hypothetical protein [Paracoccaceae bacterium]